MSRFVNPRPVPASIPRRDRQPSSSQLAAGIAALETLEADLAPALPVDPRVVSSAHGAFEHILLTYPNYAGGDLSLEATYGELLARLPQTCKITILAHPFVTDDLTRLIQAHRGDNPPTVVKAPDYLAFSVWAEDGYVAVTDIGRDPHVTFLVEPFSFPRYGDSLIADLVAEATDVQATQVPLYFQGGNVLIGDDFIFIGSDYLTRTLETWRDSEPVILTGGTPPERVRRLFSRSFDPTRRVRFIGLSRPVSDDLIAPRTFQQDGEEWTEEVGAGAGSLQPIFHIDMFMTLAGRNPDGDRYRVLVGDPAAAGVLLGESPPDHALPWAFDQIAKRLERLGYEVIRTPLPRVYVDYPRQRLRQWYFATSNNCLVEITENTQRVWLPTYGHGPWEALRVTDEANRAIWEELGFDVVQLGDFHPFAQNLGALHCIKKYLARS